MFVCLYQRISLTTEPIWFSLTGQLFIGPGKVYNYSGGGYHHPPKKIAPKNSPLTIFFLLFLLNPNWFSDQRDLKLPTDGWTDINLLCIIYYRYLCTKVTIWKQYMSFVQNYTDSGSESDEVDPNNNNNNNDEYDSYVKVRGLSPSKQPVKLRTSTSLF